MESPTPYIVILITAPSTEVGRQISVVLLERGLAACVNVIGPIRSLYTWEGRIHNDEEVLLIVKTRADLFGQAADVVRAVHPYQIPEIIALPILAGAENYLNWVWGMTNGNRT